MNMQGGDSERDRPRRLNEPKGTGWYPEPQDGDWGSPHPANNRPDEWVVKREGWGSPNLTLNSGFSLKVSVASLGFKSPLSRFLFLG